ncbi:UNVERIFIED_CONTAM: hypothetical protein RMT77_008218 [Armadillidium vulgare]
MHMDLRKHSLSNSVVNFWNFGFFGSADPHVRVIGLPAAVQEAAQKIRYELQPHRKITMKMDVSWTSHSHIIGKGGNTIQAVVKRTGVSIHFPDGNKNSEVHKSNQVSINSRGEELNGLEEARSAIRELTPLIFTFSLPAAAQFIRIVDTSVIILQIQNTYNVQAELQLINEDTLFGSVKGNEWDAVRVKEATLCLLHALCGNLANQMTVQLTVEVSPQHHAFILGPHSEVIQKIMQKTSTRISFPDLSDSLLPPLSRSTVKISGAIENVYLAKQNLIGCLPLVLMFEVPNETSIDLEVNQIMQTLDVIIIDRSKRADGRRSIVIKGAERNASNIYEAWRYINGNTKTPLKAKIPPDYFIPEMEPVLNNELRYLANQIPDRRAPGCEKKHGMVVVDYVLKKMLAAKAMKQPIQSEPRVPTSVWSGYGFSKSNPLFSISQLIKDEANLEDSFTAQNDSSELACYPKKSQMEEIDQLAYDLYRSEILLRPKPLFDSSVSRDLDSNLSKSIFGKSVSSDVTSTLLCLQLEQYADIFASQEIDYDKFITLNDQDLKDLGLNVYGHRRKLLLAIRELALEREANFMKV